MIRQALTRQQVLDELNRPHRCDRCSRIMFPKSDGSLPHHRVPEVAQRIPEHGTFGSVPLTGTGQPWCEGGGSR